jgi:Tol biopolymer transport system component
MTLLVGIALAACGDGGGGPGDGPTITAVAVTPAHAAIEVGETETFTATALDARAAPVAATFAWNSSELSVASIEAGIATGVSQGTTHITASARGVTSPPATLVVAAGSENGDPGTGPGVADTIAFVRSAADDDEIWLIAPDGSGERRLWSTDSEYLGAGAVTSLAWRPDGRELAFTSRHERDCSILDADVYGVRPDGGGFRRITSAPSCAALATFPQGSVAVEIVNWSERSGLFLVYVQGAPGMRSVGLGINDVEVVTFDSVADLGDDPQWAMVTDVARRWCCAPAYVTAGAAAATSLTLRGDGLAEFGASSVTWHPDGDRLGYVLGFGTLNAIDVAPAMLDLGDFLLGEGVETPGAFAKPLAWGPPARSGEVLYAVFASEDFAGDGIYLATVGGADPGQRVVALDGLVHGLAWLPDGSGFVYSVEEGFSSFANVHHYSFESSASTPVTAFTEDFAVALDVSPDGQWVVFERRVSDLYFSSEPPSLWLVGLDGSASRRLVDDARTPAWSR